MNQARRAFVRARRGDRNAFKRWSVSTDVAHSLFYVLALVLLIGCGATPPPATMPTVVVTAAPAPTTLPLAAPTAAPNIAATDAMTLTVWAPEEFSPEAARGGAELRRQIEAFTQAHPDVQIEYQLKKRDGKGGLVDFLLQVQQLIPDHLPDLIVIDSEQLDTVAAAGLLQPLDRDVPAGARADLLPPAQKLGSRGGLWLSQPIVLEIQHLAFNKSVVRTPPASWDELLASNASFAFPADDDDAFLFQYLENHGRFSAAPQTAPLDASVILNVLTFYQKARAAKLVPDSTLSVKTTHEVWPLFADGQAALAQVLSSDYLANADRTANAGYAPLPTQDGATAALVTSWNYAILTANEKRHAAAAEFLNWIIEPERTAEWAAAARVAPARRSAFVSAVGSSDYADFLRRLLDAAIVPPAAAERAPYREGWHTAMQSVLRGQATPAEAAPKAAQVAAQ